MLSISAHRGQEWMPDIQPEDLPAWMKQEGVLVWVDIEAPTEEDFDFLLAHFHFHELAIEDVRLSHQRPKIDFYRDHAFIVFYVVDYDEVRGVQLEEVELFVGTNYLVTVHDRPLEELNETQSRWSNDITRISHNVGTLLYSVLDGIMDGYFPALDWISEHLDGLETQIFDEFNGEILRQLTQLKRDLLSLRRVVGPQRDVINILMRDETGILPEEAGLYLQDLYDHSLRVVEMVDGQREMVTAATEGYLAVQSNKINEVMRRLTIVNLLFLPLAVLTGFFGMNFEMLPFDNPMIFGVALGGMILFPLGLYVWLQKKGWG